MTGKIEPYINDYIDNKLTDLDVFKLKNTIYDCIRNDYEFTYSELLFICKYFSWVCKFIKPSKELLLASIEADGSVIGTKDFVIKLCDEDANLAMNIYKRCTYFPKYLQKYLTLSNPDIQIENECSEERNYDAIENNSICSNYDDYDRRIEEKLLEDIYSKKHVYCAKDVRLVSEENNESLLKITCDVSTFDVVKNKYIFHYISDLHLDNKIFKNKRFLKSVDITIDEILSKAANDIRKSIAIFDDMPNGGEFEHILLIAGDISYDIEIVKRFFDKLEKVLEKYIKIYYVLGNHELWNGNPSIGLEKYELSEVIYKYRNMLRGRYQVTLLNNEIRLVLNDNPDITISFDEIKTKNIDKDLTDILSKCEYVIYGGTGFAGNSEDFNVNHGIYRNLTIDRNTEKNLSSQHSYVLNKLLQNSNGKDVICLTHMPPRDWYDFQSDSSKCIFVNGHTHRNLYEENKFGKFYGDNQVGYQGNSYFLKSFFINVNVNTSDEYQDGIYPIKAIDYYFITGKSSVGKLLNDQLFLLCKDGVKMFVAKNKQGTLHIINGGIKKKLEYKDINYYYDNLTNMAQSLCDSFEGFNKYINEVSNVVKKLGGSGYVHGCIVDIDLLSNKIYVNPFDGTITPYAAPELYSGKRTIYRSIKQLLDETPCRTSEVISMSNNYLMDKSNYSLVETNRNIPESIHTYSDSDSFVMAYKVSRKMKKILCLFDNNILKDWDENFIAENKNKQLLK